MDKERGFFDYFLKLRGKWWVIIPIILGVLLILFSTVGTSHSRKSDEWDIEDMCSSVEGVGECRVMLSYSADGHTVVAVAVICEGGESITVRHRLTELLSSLYGIGYHRISVEKMG